MIDTDKYEGHTKGNNEVGWRVNNNFVSNGECPNDIYIAYVRGTLRLLGTPRSPAGIYEVIEFSDADAQLIADAPLLLAEVKRLQERLDWILGDEELASYVWEKEVAYMECEGVRLPWISADEWGEEE